MAILIHLYKLLSASCSHLKPFDTSLGYGTSICNVANGS
jgi:hypothetical protein